MAYNFLGLVNQICHKVNEVPLTEINFGSAQGFYSVAKDAVNRAIKDINNSEDYWRFNYRERIQLMAAGTNRYTLPDNHTTVDFDTFRIGTNVELVPPASGDWWDSAVWADSTDYSNVLTFTNDKNLSFRSKWLKPLDYDDYLQNYSYREFSVETQNEPTHVVKTPTNSFIVYPTPVFSTPVFFDYYTIPTELENALDVPTVPQKYDFVVFTGAMRDVYSFREDDFNAEKSEVYFRNQIKEMRRREINIILNVRSGVK